MSSIDVTDSIRSEEMWSTRVTTSKLVNSIDTPVRCCKCLSVLLCSLPLAVPSINAISRTTHRSQRHSVSEGEVEIGMHAVEAVPFKNGDSHPTLR